MSLMLYDTPKDEEFAAIVSCIHKVDYIHFNPTDLTVDTFEMLSAAISNRPTPVS